MKVKRCIAKRPGGKVCDRVLPSGSKAFCDRCDGENFKSKPKFRDMDEADNPNTYEPEPVEIPINDANPIRGYFYERDND